MLPVTQAVWRHLLNNARRDRRSWPNLHTLANELALGVSTTHKALTLPAEIGAVRVTRALGVQTLSPHRLLTLFAAHRRLARDVTSDTHVVLSATDVELQAVHDGRTVGGFGALVSHLGHNPVAIYSTAMIYAPAGFADQFPRANSDDPQATRLLTLEPDPRLPAGQVVPFCQAWADVFCDPSWQGDRFIEQIDPWQIVSPVPREHAHRP